MQAEKLMFTLNSLGLIFCMVLFLFLWGGLACFEAGLIRRRGVVTLLTQKWAGAAVSLLGFFMLGMRFYGSESTFFLFPIPHNIQLSGPLSLVVKGRLYAYPLEYLLHALLTVLGSSLLTGVLAERLRTWPYLFFCALFSMVIYPICGFWIWQEGFLSQLGFIDYSGAGPIFLVGSAACLAGLLRLPKRITTNDEKVLLGSNFPFTALGGFGAFIGFLGLFFGSNLSFSTPNDAVQLTHMFENFLLASSVGIVMGLFIGRFWFGKNDMTLGLNGMLAALTTLTASPIATTSGETLLIAAISSFLSLMLMFILNRFFDDPCGYLATFGASSLIGLILLPFWQTEAHFLVQMMGIGVLFGFSFLVSFIYFYLMDKAIGLKQDSQEFEIHGIDMVDCGFEAYPEFLEKN